MKVPLQLNAQQQKAVLTIGGPLLVIAGAGAGKTRVIVERIREIIRQGVAPEKVLAVTFTNKAAQEMRNRIQGSTFAQGSPRSNLKDIPFISTFHSLGLTLIKENHKVLGLKRNPAIYDRGDSLREIKHALKTIGAEDLEPRMVLAVISRNKGEGVDADSFTAGATSPMERDVARAWLVYEKELRESGALDFDDLLVRAVVLLQTNPEVRKKYQERWEYLHIDEYQDTNAIQATLAELLVGPQKNICVVGDLDQTIYGWRGAMIENMLSFEKKFGGHVVVLEQNYRSSQNILDAANELIANNPNRPEKRLFTEAGPGEKLALYAAGDGGDEALFVARKIGELIHDGARPQSIAVLYRANFQSRAIEEKLLDAGIPYQVLGTRFFERKEVKDVLAWLRAAISETPTELARVIDTLSGVGKVSKLKILAGQEHTLAPKIRERLSRARATLQKIGVHAANLQPSHLVRMAIVESGIEQTLKDDKIEGGERLENLRELVSLAVRYDGQPAPSGLEAFLESAALASDQDELKEERDAVRLMTVHAAKGLEFPYVFIVGLEEGLFPYSREDEEKNAIEEERRLMYVALTRAQKKIYLSFAMMRTVFGSTDIRQASTFLQELPQELIEPETPERLGKTIYLD